MGQRSPILGYNHNVGYRGLVFHVQTEDSGVNNPHIFTHLFHGGVIISTRRLDYDAEAADDVVKALMQAQHKAVLKELRRGMFDDKIDAFLSANPELLPRPSRRDTESDAAAAISADESAGAGEPKGAGEREPVSASTQAQAKSQGPDTPDTPDTTDEAADALGDTFEQVIELQAEPPETALAEPEPEIASNTLRDTLEAPVLAPMDELEEAEVAVAFRSIMTEDEGIKPPAAASRRAATSPGLAIPPHTGTAAPRPVKPAPPPLPSGTTGRADIAAPVQGNEAAKQSPVPRPTQPTIRGTPIKPPPPPVIKGRPASTSPVRASTPSTTDRPLPAKPAPRAGGVVISRPPIIVESRQGKGTRPAPAAARQPRVPPSRKVREERQDGLFDQNLISEKSLDEVILAYLSEDSSEEE